MGIFQYLRLKNNKNKNLDTLRLRKESLEESISSTLSSKDLFSKYMTILAGDLTDELERYNEMYYSYCRAYYENELFYREFYNDKNSLALFDQIDKLVDTIYNSTPIDETEDGLKHHKLVIKNARDIIDAMLHENKSTRFKAYLSNCETIAKIKPQLTPYEIPVIASKFPRARELYTNYTKERRNADICEHAYNSDLARCVQTYPTDCDEYEEIKLPKEVDFGHNKEFDAVDQFINPGKVLTAAKSFVIGELYYARSGIEPKINGD